MSRIALLLAALPLLSFAGGFSSDGCSAEWTDCELRVSNALFERTYFAAGGVLRTRSVSSHGGVPWLGVTNGTERMDVSARKIRWSPVGVEGIRVSVTIGTGRTDLDLYPGVPGVIVRRGMTVLPKPAHDLERDFRTLKDWSRDLRAAADRSDGIGFVHRHVRLTETVCADQSDIRDDLVCSRQRILMNCDWPFSVATSILDIQDVLTEEGLAFVRMAPMPVSRQGGADDFVVDGEWCRLSVLANGYPVAELAYRGGDEGRRRALVAFQRALRPYRPERDGILLSNTWGAGMGDSRICQDFLLKEIDAGSRLGVDVIQVDDGWEKGRTENSRRKLLPGQKKLWNGYWDAEPDFWTEDRERFPDGLGFLTNYARRKGVRFGLWYGPDSANEAANWEKDVACLLDFHARYGIDYFKLDSLKLYTPRALERNRQMFDRLLSASEGAMVFDFDCTAEIRPGFFGLMDVGPVFVENRGTKQEAYWPHHTLKNLWDLAHYVDAVRLRLEFCNPDTYRALYDWSPLAPANYRADALFATVMAASPLAWMEVSELSEASFSQLIPLVARWKKERSRWHQGVIHPVANRPDGVAWTGFVSESTEGHGGYALLFRELNEMSRYTLDLNTIFAGRLPTEAVVIGGRGIAKIDGHALVVEIDRKLDYLWMKLD